MTYCKKISLLLTVMALSLLLAGCNGNGDNGDDIDLPIVQRVDGSITIDGLPDGYLGDVIMAADMEVRSAHDGENLYIHARTEAEGWISVGMNQKGKIMDGATMILGYIDENGEGKIRQDIGKGFSHAEVSQGVELDYIVFMEDHYQVMEFAIPLITPGEQGYVLEQMKPGNTYTLIFAYNASSTDLSRRHNQAARVDIFLAE